MKYFTRFCDADKGGATGGSPLTVPQLVQKVADLEAEKHSLAGTLAIEKQFATGLQDKLTIAEGKATELQSKLTETETQLATEKKTTCELQTKLADAEKQALQAKETAARFGATAPAKTDAAHSKTDNTATREEWRAMAPKDQRQFFTNGGKLID